MISYRKSSSIDEIIRLYEKDLDTTLITENLKLTPTERVKKLEDLIKTYEILQNAKPVSLNDKF